VNIFFVDNCPIKAAQSLCDKHVNKMITESAQLLANCYLLDVLTDECCPRTKNGNVRCHSYFNHPCSVWVRTSLSNFSWLVRHAFALCQEKLFRTGKQHFCWQFIAWCMQHPPDLNDIGLTIPAFAFGTYMYLSDENNPVQSYRNYYMASKRYDKNGNKMDVYSVRKRPDWFEELE